MIQGILIVILLAITIGFVIAFVVQVNKKRSPNKKLETTFISGAIVGALLMFTIPGSFHQVEAGTVAIVKRLGKIVGVRTPGTHFDFYMVNEYDIYDTKVQQDKILTSAYSKDGQTMDLEVFLQYQIQINNVENIATEYGSLDALQARIETVTIEKTKAVMSSAEAMNIIQNRSLFSENVSMSVRAGISSDYYVNVKDVVLTNIDFTDEFEKSVEDKVIAEQEKQAAITRAEAELEVARIEAERKIAEAQGNAEAVKILAQGEAEAAASKIIELARSLGFEIKTEFIYNKVVISESVDGTNYKKEVSEEIHTSKQTETTTVETVGEVIKTTTFSQVGTKYTINYDANHTKEDLNKMVISYLEYLAYLEKWNGELPDVVSGDDALSIIIPTNN